MVVTSLCADRAYRPSVPTERHENLPCLQGAEFLEAQPTPPAARRSAALSHVELFENFLVRHALAATVEERFSSRHVTVGLFRELSFRLGWRHIPACGQRVEQFSRYGKIGFRDTVQGRV